MNAFENVKVWCLWTLVVLGIVFILEHGGIVYYLTQKFQRISNVSLLHCQAVIEAEIETTALSNMLKMENDLMLKNRKALEQEESEFKLQKKNWDKSKCPDVTNAASQSPGKKVG